jgi:hypothetical protein
MVIKSWIDVLGYLLLLALILAFGLFICGYAILFLEAHRSENKKQMLRSLITWQHGFPLFSPKGPRLIYAGAFIGFIVFGIFGVLLLGSAFILGSH